MMVICLDVRRSPEDSFQYLPVNVFGSLGPGASPRQLSQGMDDSEYDCSVLRLFFVRISVKMSDQQIYLHNLTAIFLLKHLIALEKSLSHSQLIES